MIYFYGTSFAANTLREAARRRGLAIAPLPERADLIFVSEDTPTDSEGVRNYSGIVAMIGEAETFKVPIVLTSQVEVGFCRDLDMANLYHQSETLRIEDGMQRGMFPQQFIVGTSSGLSVLPPEYLAYLRAFDCPVHQMLYEEAEFAKMAINRSLAMQVENTNWLAGIADKWGIRWPEVARVLRHDARIGKYAYLTPGRWQDSPHLLRDHVSLKGMANEPF